MALHQNGDQEGASSAETGIRRVGRDKNDEDDDEVVSCTLSLGADNAFAESELGDPPSGSTYSLMFTTYIRCKHH